MWKRALIYGAAVAAASAVLTALMGAMGLQAAEGGGQLVGYLGYLFPIVGITLAIRSAKREEKDEFTFGDGFKQGAAVSAMAALLTAVFTYLYVSSINPEFTEALRQATAAKLEAQGYTGRELAQARSVSDSMTSPGALSTITFFSQLVVGLIVSAVAALFLRRKADPAQYR